MRLVQELKWQDGETGPKDFPIPLLGHTARRQDGAVNRTFSLLVQSAVNVRVDPSAWAANVTIEGLHEVVPDPPGSSVELSPSGLFHRYIGSVEVTATPSPPRKPGDPPIDIWYSVNPLLGTEHTTCVAVPAVTSVCGWELGRRSYLCVARWLPHHSLGEPMELYTGPFTLPVGWWDVRAFTVQHGFQNGTLSSRQYRVDTGGFGVWPTTLELPRVQRGPFDTHIEVFGRVAGASVAWHLAAGATPWLVPSETSGTGDYTLQLNFDTTSLPTGRSSTTLVCTCLGPHSVAELLAVCLCSCACVCVRVLVRGCSWVRLTSTTVCAACLPCS